MSDSKKSLKELINEAKNEAQAEFDTLYGNEYVSPLEKAGTSFLS